MDDLPDPGFDAPHEWHDVLRRSEADVASGRTLPWDELRAHIVARIATMEAKPGRRQA